MNYPALIFWAVIAWSFTASPATVLVLLLASLPFASLALLPPEIAGGMSILPQSMFAIVLISKVVVPQVMPISPKLATALRLRHLGSLAIFLLIGIVATVIMPTYFSGDIVVVPMRYLGGAGLLTPTQSNFTQSGYITLSIMTTFAVMLMADEQGFVGTLLTGVLAGSSVCIVTGLIDFGAASTGMESLLEPFRNANYSYLTNSTAGGIRRVVGFTPEASTYGPICVQFAAAVGLLRTFYARGRQRILATMVTVGLILMALLSTSSSAYVGLAALGLVYLANWVRRALLSSALGQGGLALELFAGLSLIVAFLFILLARAELFDPLLKIINEIIFNKAQTSSFYERSFWNTTAWNTVASSWGLGVGFGSTRTSNWFAAIASSAGVIGAAFMVIFLVQTFTRRLARNTALFTELMTAMKMSLLPALAMASIDMPGSDFGQWMGVLFGAIAGIAVVRPDRKLVDHVTADMPTLKRAGGPKAIGRRAFGRVVAARRDRGPGGHAPRPSL